MQKASLNLRERIKPDPYLSNFSKSKQLMARIKEKPKNYKGTYNISQAQSLSILIHCIMEEHRTVKVIFMHGNRRGIANIII